MRFESPLLFGRLVRRYKRFLADIDLDDGRRIVAHTPNSGSMLGYATAGLRVAVSHQPSPTRKLAWTWELVDAGSGWVGISQAQKSVVLARCRARDNTKTAFGRACVTRASLLANRFGAEGDGIGSHQAIAVKKVQDVFGLEHDDARLTYFANGRRTHGRVLAGDPGSGPNHQRGGPQHRE